MIYKGATLLIATSMAINGGNYFLTQGNSLNLNDKASYKESVGRTEKLNSLGNYKNVNLDGVNPLNITNDLGKYKDLEEGTIVVRFNLKDSKIQTLLGISNSKTRNGYFNFYVTNSKVGFEVRNQKNEGNTQVGTENLAHIYKDAILNPEENTVALKVEKNKGYKLYLNGKIINDVKDNNTKFIKNIANLDSAFIGKTKRYGQANEYNLKGNIEFLNIYKEPLSDEYLINKTGETKEKEEELVDGAVKTKAVDLFYKGYLNSNNYRIPALFTTKKGTLLASIDARISNGADSPNNIDTAIRRSEDGGKTWNTGKIIIDYPDKASTIDTSLIQDDETGRIFLLVTHFPSGYGFGNSKKGNGFKDINGKKYLCLYNSLGNEFTVRDNVVYDKDGKKTEYTIDSNSNLYKNNKKISNITASNSPLKIYGTSYIDIIYSDDDGKTWSSPKNINYEVKENWMKFMGVAPGRGIQIKNGKHKGRIVYPIYYTNENNKQSSAVIYSDDHGKTWTRGESPNDNRKVSGGRVINSKTLNDNSYQLTECQAVEMPDGQLKLFMRNLTGYLNVATSFDGGATWDENVEKDTDVLEPYCQLTAINYSEKIDGKDAIIFANPDARDRSNGTVRIGLIDKVGTYNNGEPKYKINWKYKKLVKRGYYAYSCLSELNNGNIGLFYEGTPNEEMSYIEMNLKYLDSNLNNVNKETLSKLLSENKDTTGMTPESVTKYREAINHGEEILNNGSVSKETITNVIKEIEKAKNGLEYSKSILSASPQNNIKKN